MKKSKQSKQSKQVRLTQCQLDYLNQRRNQTNVNLKLAAKETGLTVPVVKGWFKQNPPEPSPQTTLEPVEDSKLDVRIGKYIVQDGTVIMTERQSKIDDQKRNLPTKEEFWEAHKDHLHKIVMKSKKVRPKQEDD